MRSRVATLLLLSFLTFVLGLGRQAMSDGDEGYYAEAAREMVESGDWLTPHFNYEDRWQKPILYYWVTAATFVATGTSEWGARAFSALSGVLLVLLTYRIGRRMFEREDEAWVGAAIVATCYGSFALARLALPDLPLALFITLCIYLWLEGRHALAGGAAALGLLDKGPLALLIPALVLLPIAWRERHLEIAPAWTRISLRPADLMRAALVCLLIAAPWYLAMLVEHGSAYLQSFFIGDNLARFATDRFNEPRSLWFYVPIIIGGIFPWMAYLLILPWRRVAALARKTSSLTPVEWRLAIWTTMPLLFFTASIGKQPRYILPVLPPLALLVGASIARHIAGAVQGDRHRARALAVATGTTAMVLLVLSVLLFRAGPVLINAYPSLTLVGVLTCALGGVTLAWTVATAAWPTLPVRMAGCAAGVLLSLQFGAFAGIRPEAVEIMAGLGRLNRSSGETVGSYRTLERNLTFYTGVPQVPLFDDDQVRAFLMKGERVLLVARAQDVLRLQKATGIDIKALGSVDYVDPAAIRLSTLLSPDPRRDVTDLILVANR